MRNRRLPAAVCRRSTNAPPACRTLMKVRRAALSRLGEHTIRAGMPTAKVEEPLVPIFMYHRYAVESAASMVAGQDYIFAMRGDNRTPTRSVHGQVRAIASYKLS